MVYLRKSISLYYHMLKLKRIVRQKESHYKYGTNETFNCLNHVGNTIKWPHLSAWATNQMDRHSLKLLNLSLSDAGIWPVTQQCVITNPTNLPSLTGRQRGIQRPRGLWFTNSKKPAGIRQTKSRKDINCFVATGNGILWGLEMQHRFYYFQSFKFVLC